MVLKNLFVLFTSIYLLSFSSYSQTEYIQCDSLIIKIKQPLIGFDKVFLKEDNKWIRIESFQLTENKYVLYALKSNQKKCFKDECRVDIKIIKSTNNSKFFDYQSEVNNDFCQIDGSNKCYKRNKGKNLQKGYCSIINYKE